MSALGARQLVITVDGADYTAEVSKATIVAKKATPDDWRYSLCGPSIFYDLEFTAVQDLAPGSLWRVLWSRVDELVPCLLKPYGNDVATEAQPHYELLAWIEEPEGAVLGGEASVSRSARQTIECVWPLEAKPLEVMG